MQSKQTGREKGANGVYNVIGEGERLLLAIPQRAAKISAAGGENISSGRGKYQQRALRTRFNTMEVVFRQVLL